MNPDTVWIISTVITAVVALASLMYALVNGVHKWIVAAEACTVASFRASARSAR